MTAEKANESVCARSSERTSSAFISPKWREIIRRMRVWSRFGGGAGGQSGGDRRTQAFRNESSHLVLTVDAREDERISRSALMRVPEVLSGDYIAATNSFYRGDPVVLSYKLGKNFRTEALLLEAPDAIFESGEAGENAAEFRGVISFYNYRSGNFDDIEAGKTRFTAEELAPYFAAGSNHYGALCRGEEHKSQSLGCSAPVDYRHRGGELMLVFSDVRKAYRNLEVLKGLTLSVPRGSLFGRHGAERRR